MLAARNILCDFASKEIRRVYGLHKNVSASQQIQILCEWLNVAQFLCAEWCVIPIGFAAECEVLQSALRKKEAYLLSRALRLSMRESEVEQFVARRRIEYAPFDDDYPALFVDRTIKFLARYAVAFFERQGHSATSIREAWTSGADTSRLWTPIRDHLSTETLKTIRDIPYGLSQIGLGVTWNAVKERLPAVDEHSAQLLRRVLHHDFVCNYMTEYQVDIITRLPFGWRDLGVRPLGGPYDYELFAIAAGPVKELILKLSAEDILTLRQSPGHAKFLASYLALAGADSQILDVRTAYAYAWQETAKQTQRLLSRFRPGVAAALDVRSGTQESMAEFGFVLEELSNCLGRHWVDPSVISASAAHRIIQIRNIDMSKHITIGAGAHVSAPILIADTITESFNTVKSIKRDDLRDEAKKLIDTVSKFASSLPPPDAERVSSELSVLVKALAGSDTTSHSKSELRDRLQRFAASLSGYGSAAVAVIETIHQIASLFH